MQRSDALDRLTAARVGVLGTTDRRGRPHLVPISYALVGEAVVHMVDHKPKRTLDLRRLANIRANPEATILVQRYDDDWRSLWWVRIDGPASIVERGEQWNAARVALAAKYHQYVEQPPLGPAIYLEIERVTGWEARQ